MPRESREVGDLVNALQRVLAERPNPAAMGAHDIIPRYIMDSIEPWDPSRTDKIPIRDYFEIFDDFTSELTERQRVTLLKIKMRGEAQTFLVDHPQLRGAAHPYTEVKTAIISWFDREDLDSVLRKLMTARLGDTEGLREFAERVRRLARNSVRKEFSGITAVQQGAVAAERARSAFIRGLPPALSRPLLATSPKTLEEALKRAEDMQNVGMDATSDPDEWRISALRNQERRCYLCHELGHMMAQCPNRDGRRGQEPFMVPPKVFNTTTPRPNRPCLFCQRLDHFPVDCSRIPQCELCGKKGHQEKDCNQVVLGRSDDPSTPENE